MTLRVKLYCMVCGGSKIFKVKKEFLNIWHLPDKSLNCRECFVKFKDKLSAFFVGSRNGYHKSFIVAFHFIHLCDVCIYLQQVKATDKAFDIRFSSYDVSIICEDMDLHLFLVGFDFQNPDKWQGLLAVVLSEQSKAKNPSFQGEL